MSKQQRVITAEELKKHNKKGEDAWISLYGRVYDVTKFGVKHPGGDIIYEALGKDGTLKHYEIGHSIEAHEVLKSYEIGVLKDWKPPADFEWPPYIQPLSKL